jgi:hypothetical protein
MMEFSVGGNALFPGLIMLFFVIYFVGGVVANSKVFDFALQAREHSIQLHNITTTYGTLGVLQNHEPINRNHSTISDEKLNLADPYIAWEQYRKTEPGEGFWEKDVNTTLQSNAADFFSQFLDDYDSVDSFRCRERGKGHAKCFIEVYTGVYNFGCRIDQESRCKFDKGSLVIMTHIDTMWPSWSTVDKVQMGRKVYFTLLNLEDVMGNLISNAVSVLEYWLQIIV